MSANPFVTSDVDDQITRRFLCCLYQLSRNRNDVHQNGLAPRDIYNLLELSPEGEEHVNAKVKWLVDRCFEKGYIEPGNNGRIKITGGGNKQCESIDGVTGHSYCSGLPSYTGGIQILYSPENPDEKNKDKTKAIQDIITQSGAELTHIYTPVKNQRVDVIFQLGVQIGAESKWKLTEASLDDIRQKIIKRFDKDVENVVTVVDE